jgi:predicted phage baseplate assembly protein
MRLAKSPVTYRPAPGGGRSDGSTLLVRVGGLQWHERDSLYGAAPADRAFVTHIDDAGRIAVRFGDGDSGARPATGAEVRASYRRGLGAHGNVPAGALSVPLDRPAGLKGVINPLPAAGGVDPERPSDTRVNAPGSVRTFGRIVSLRDFEDQARATGLVSKARAAWTWAGTEPLVALTVAGPGGAHVRDLVHEDLAADLDARRDPNRRLRIDDYDEVAIAVRAKIVAHDPDRKAEDVVAAATAALDALFAFDARGLGQPVHLSDVFAALQSATGVVGVDIDKLGYRDASAWTAHQLASVAVAEHLPVLPNELAALAAADREVTIQ